MGCFRSALASIALVPVIAVSLSVADAFKPSLVQWMRLSPDGQRVLAFGSNKEATGAVSRTSRR